MVKQLAIGLGHLTLLVAAALFWNSSSWAEATLFVGEPYDSFGAFNPTGHASVYLSRVCADTPIVLRRCESGETGIVLSRYHGIAGYDWIAVPLIAYLYAVEDAGSIPTEANSETVDFLRDQYRHKHLQEIVPDPLNGKTPNGSWVELVGAAYDRKIYAFSIKTTEEQDARLVIAFNSRNNKSHFNLFFNNCADFVRRILDTYYPGVIHRNYIADFGMTTPKQVARSLVLYAKQHRDFSLSAFYVPQIPGRHRKSHRITGVSEALVRSKKYIVPLAVVQPWLAGTIVGIYLARGRFDIARHAATPRWPSDMMLDSGDLGYRSFIKP